MSDLHPSARSLIERAKRREATLPDEVRGRVHRSVLRRATALGAAVATTTSATVAAKASALAGAFASPLVVSATLSGLAGVAFLVATAVSMPPAPVRPPPLPAMTQRLAHPSVAPSLSHMPELAAAPSLLEPAAIERGARPPGDGSGLDGIRGRPSLPAAASVPGRKPAREEPDVNATPTFKLAAAPVSTEEAAPGQASVVATPGRDPEMTARGAAGSAPPPVADSRPQRVTASALAVELDLLHQVNAALRARQPAWALALLDRVEHAAAPGPLDEEAQAARISALCQLGRDADARRAMDRFVAKWPGSPVATRLQGGCATLGAADGDQRN